MDIPTNDEGVFEVVDGQGAVVGHGIVNDEQVVDFAYTDGTSEGRTVVAVDQFAEVWTKFSLGEGLTIRAAA